MGLHASAGTGERLDAYGTRTNEGQSYERRGIDFEDAIQIFDSPVWETLSPRTGEQR